MQSLLGKKWELVEVLAVEKSDDDPPIIFIALGIDVKEMAKDKDDEPKEDEDG